MVVSLFLVSQCNRKCSLNFGWNVMRFNLLRLKSWQHWLIQAWVFPKGGSFLWLPWRCPCSWSANAYKGFIELSIAVAFFAAAYVAVAFAWCSSEGITYLRDCIRRAAETGSHCMTHCGSQRIEFHRARNLGSLLIANGLSMHM